LLVLIVLLLAAGGVKLSRVVAADMLRADAQATARAWANSLVESADDIPAIIAGVSPSDKTVHLLKLASEVGSVYRYKVWNKTGNLVFISDQMYPPMGAMTIANDHGQRVADSILSGSTFTEAGAGTPPVNPPYFVESYVPLIRDKAVIGVFEVYLDQTADYALYQKSFLLTECIIAVAVLFAGGVPGFMFYRKMRDHRTAQAQALFLAEHDSLTGIPNRKWLEETANGALAWTRRNKGYVAVLLIDLDRFKDINDSFGHGVGDSLLQVCATRIRSAIRSEDMVSRLGGDEFVVLQIGLSQPSGATYLADRLMKILDEPYDIGDLDVRCGASIGIAIAPTDAMEWDQLLSCSDAALYKAKAEGRNTICFFEAGMDAIVRERRRVEVELRRALDTNAFHLAYQPLVSFHDGSLVGFEALLRWPQGWGELSPVVFIPIAEESGLIVPIGAWVLETACKTAAAWAKPLKVAVNLSPVQFRHGDIVATVERALSISGLDPEHLELEVTESLWLQNTDAVLDQLARLRSIGVTIALDDFGTGYSSLTHLWKFTFDAVKIDRSFVMEMNLDPKAAAIINTIVAMGRTLDLVVTAEGVETAAQAQALSEAGCDQAQGYWFGRPLSTASANELINSSTPSAVTLQAAGAQLGEGSAI
jgi:diguanylate cyclase (GGDEF)-like protein